jgi:glycosyltransferase involved in cell wall biosynthesis
MLLSVIIPCYNEENTIQAIVDQVQAINLDKEIIIVDDCSNDRTPMLLADIAIYPNVKNIRHEANRGKGEAIRSGLSIAQGDIVIIQDADTEYDPNDYYELVRPIIIGKVDVVFGSRFMGRHTGMYFWNAVGNKFLTMLTNFLYNSWISDMETCYKVMRTDIMRSICLQSRDFRIEAEITAKILRLGYRIYEVPISYMGRSYEEGKKIKKIDGLKAIGTLLRFRTWSGKAPKLQPIEPVIAMTALQGMRERVAPDEFVAIGRPGYAVPQREHASNGL